MAKKSNIDLSNMNLFYEDRNQTIKLQNLKRSSMNIEVAIYEKDKFIKNNTIAFAHVPKKIKAKLNPLC